MKAARAATNRSPYNPYTSPADKKNNPNGWRIDHILYKHSDRICVETGKWSTTLHRIPGLDIHYSDHEAVHVEFNIAAPGAGACSTKTSKLWIPINNLVLSLIRLGQTAREQREWWIEISTPRNSKHHRQEYWKHTRSTEPGHIADTHFHGLPDALQWLWPYEPDKKLLSLDLYHVFTLLQFSFQKNWT